MQPHIHESAPCRLVLQLRTYRCNAVNRRFGPNSGSDAYSRSSRRETAIVLNRYRGNPHLERVVLRWEVSFHFNRRAREN
jgi:hypothetical protein